MGRLRLEENEGLPKGMSLKSGRYYFVTTTPPRKWIPLGRSYEPALAHYKTLIRQDKSNLVRPKINATVRSSPKARLKEGVATKSSLEAVATKLLSRSKINAKSRNLRNDLSLDDVVALLKRANGRCEVSGIEFDYTWESESWQSRPWIPSIDRKNNRNGYYLSNCRITCHAANRAIGEWGIDVFSKLCSTFISSKNSRTM